MKTILVIDDRASNRDFLRALLTYAGHRVITANDGLEGLQRARENLPDLVICDVLMPVMDGYEFVRHLRSDGQLAAIEVVLSTAYFHEHEAYRLAQRCGVRHVLSKPSEPDEVLNLVERLLSESPVPPPPPPEDDFAQQHRRLLTDRLLQTQDSLERVDSKLLSYVSLNLSLAAMRQSENLLAALCEGARGLLHARYALALINGAGNFAAPLLASAGLDTASTLEPWSRFRPEPRRPKSPLAAPALRLSGDPDARRAIGIPEEFPPFRSALLAAIVSPDRRYGWLLLAEPEQADDFADSDLSLIATLAAHAGRIHENHHLFERARRHADQLQAEVATRIGMQRRIELQYAVARVFIDTDNFDEAVTRLLRTLVARLDIDAAALWELDRHNNCLRCIARSERDAADNAAPPAVPTLFAGEGVAGQCWSRVQPVWQVRAVAEGTDREDGELSAGTDLAFPLILNEQVIGAVELYARQARPASIEFLDSLMAIGSQIAQFLERRSQYGQIRRLNRIHAVLSGINSTIVRSRDRVQVLAEACQLAVSEGQFEVAWIALAEAAAAPLNVQVWHSAGYPQALASAEPGGYPQRIAARALHSGLPECSNNLLDDPAIHAGECTQAIAAGLRAYAALPLRSDAGVVGVMSLYSREPGVFNPGELTLLREVAEDISFALSTIHTRELLSFSASRDPLTGLYNRAGFIECLRAALAEGCAAGESIAVLCCDLKRFRHVNETFGRDAGDRMLKEFAHRLAEHWADWGGLARIGNDVFAAVLAGGQSPSELVQRFGAWRDTDLGGPFQINGHAVTTRARLGIAMYPADAQSAEVLLERAESALQNCKLSGQTYLFFQAEMTERVAGSLRMESRLRAAIRNDGLALHYQPKIDLLRGQMTGVEALLRWRDAELGEVAPSAFVPLLEETGLILEVGEWAMRQALIDMQRCSSPASARPRVAVNVSPLQLAQGEFVQRVLDTLHRHGHAHGGLELEITESLVMEDVESNIRKIALLRERDIKTAIDDFGTGYSSLAYLAQLPVSALKIDRAFVKTMLEQRESRAIVATTISLAHALGLRVIAEGVESSEQAELLRSLKCDEIQGFLICKPLPIDDLLAWIERVV